MEIEFVSKNLLTKKTPSTDGLIDEFFHLFKEEMAILQKFSQSIENIIFIWSMSPA